MIGNANFVACNATTISKNHVAANAITAGRLNVAEHRPYRPPHASSGDLRRIKALAGTTIALAFVATNSVATQHAAAMLRHSSYLGTGFVQVPRIGRLYLPWEWLVWAARWHS